jgi:hypothetical protein
MWRVVHILHQSNHIRHANVTLVDYLHRNLPSGVADHSRRETRRLFGFVLHNELVVRAPCAMIRRFGMIPIAEYALMHRVSSSVPMIIRVELVRLGSASSSLILRNAASSYSGKSGTGYFAFGVKHTQTRP